MSLRFNKDTLKEVYDEEITHFKISPGANNRIKEFLEQDIMRMTNDGRNQLTQPQILWAMNYMNTFTSADIVAYCLQLYYDGDEGDASESLYSSGIERTSAYFDTIQCEPPHPTYVGESKPEYIETVMFRCFSKYIINKGYRARDIYRFMIRFGCIFNAMSSVNIIRQVFTLLSKNDYYLRSGNLDEGSEHGYTDRNIFTGNGKIINLTSSLYSQITDRSYTDVGGQPFLLTIDYGNLDRLDAHPYAYVLPTLFYMRDNRVNDYEETKRIVIQEDLEQRQEEIRLQEERQQEQHYAKEWMKSRMQLGTKGGGKVRARKIKSKKKRMINKNKSNRYRKNKSHSRRRSSKRI
jgi:hypothetical protein